MARPVTLFTGQWADLPLETICSEGQPVGLRRDRTGLLGRSLQRPEGLSHDDGYCQGRHDLLAKYGLKCWAISNHLTGQLVLDVLDDRTDDWAPRPSFAEQHEKKRDLGDPGDEGHGPGRREDGREGRQRVHRIVDLAPALLVSAGFS